MITAIQPFSIRVTRDEAGYFSLNGYYPVLAIDSEYSDKYETTKEKHISFMTRDDNGTIRWIDEADAVIVAP